MTNIKRSGSFGLGLPGVGRLGLGARAPLTQSAPAVFEFVGATAETQIHIADAGSKLDYDIPAHSTGSLLLMSVNLNGQETTWTDITVATAGWTEVPALRGVDGNVNTRVYYKVGDGVAGIVQMENNSGVGYSNSMIIMAFSGVHVDIFDVTPTSSHVIYQPNDNTPTSPAITSATDNTIAVILHMGANANPTADPTPPSGYALAAAGYEASALASVGAYKALPTAGLETPGDWTSNAGAGQDGHALTMVLKAA